VLAWNTQDHCLSTFIALVHPFCRSHCLGRWPATITLKDAADCVTGLPKTESDLAQWQVAIEALMLCSRGGDSMLARIGVMKALNRHVERVFNPDRKETHWGSGKSSGISSPLIIGQADAALSGYGAHPDWA